MKLAENSHQLIESFFREYLNDKDFKLPEINFFAGRFAFFVAKILRIQGITIGKSILLSPETISFGSNEKKIISKSLIVHEIAHVLQYKREGFFRFMINYFFAYWKNLQKKRDWSPISRLESYLEISYEIEARKIAEDFDKWNKDKSF